MKDWPDHFSDMRDYKIPESVFSLTDGKTKLVPFSQKGQNADSRSFSLTEGSDFPPSKK